MITELYEYLTNPASQSAKKLGQLKETIAMDARHQRSKKQWESHLIQSKNFITKAASAVSKNKDAIILGSGLLLDIPINFLCAHFNHVYLVDVVHLKKVKKTIQKFNNVSLIEHDVTGLAETLLQSTTVKMAFKQDATIPNYTKNTGFVVSANMLSQIHLAPTDYAKKELTLNEGEVDKLAHAIMQSHIDMLKKTPCKVCLISDYKRFYHDNNKQPQYEEDALINIKLPAPDKQWHWEIAPLGELAPNTSMSSLVYAYGNFSAENPTSAQS